MPFKKGQSGNPAGSPPKDESIAALVRELGKRRKQIKISGKKKMVPLMEAVIYKMYDRALSGDVAAVRYLSERRDGKVPTPLEHTGADGSPLFEYNAKLDDIE